MEALWPREVDALDPKSQLQVALRLASRAFSLSETSLQQENQRLRAQLSARDAAAAALEETAASLRSAAAEAGERARLAAEAARRARGESRELASEVRRLRAEVAKAEGVRKALLRSLGDNNGIDSGGGAAGGEIGDEQVPTAAAGGAGTDNYSYHFESFSTPGVLSARAQKASAVAAAAAAADETDDDDGDGGASGRIPASYPSSSHHHHHRQQRSKKPPNNSATMMSGKDFFRAARACLPPARFEGLMDAVRALNGGRASRTAALAAASEALAGEGGGCADLVPVFEGLLSQRVPVD